MFGFRRFPNLSHSQRVRISDSIWNFVRISDVRFTHWNQTERLVFGRSTKLDHFSYKGNFYILNGLAFLTERTEETEWPECLKSELAENRTIFCSVSQTECSDFRYSLYWIFCNWVFLLSSHAQMNNLNFNTLNE